MKFNNEVEEYVYKATLWLAKHDIKVIIEKDELFRDDDGALLSGEYDAYKGIIRVGWCDDIDDFITTFIHEYCHAKQHITQKKCWMVCKNHYKKLDANQVLFDWMNGKEFSDEVVYTAVQKIRNMELDCEKMTVKELIKHGFDSFVDVTKYIQDANAYVLFHNMIYLTRKWYGPNYSKDEMNIYKIMPKTFDIDYETIPLDFYRACIEHCYK